jgi:predicted secreted Zn-dependent protease
MAKRALWAVLLTMATVPVAEAASVAKTYSYFSIGGSTLDEIERELTLRGPKVESSGRRHPGATQMEFTTRIGYAEQPSGCRIQEARVSVKAKMILPRWRRSKSADADTHLIWDTLAADIKRHEESHVIIAKNHARELEQALLKIGRQRSCAVAAERAKAASERILAKHDREQARFDRVEGMNFESRLLRLLRHRLDRMENAARRGG